MDINEVLRNIRLLSDALLNDELTNENRLTLADELAESCESLDQWISNGGFLPHDWQIKQMAF